MMSTNITSTTNPAAAFHVLTKPTGAVCNLDCKYCFFLSKGELYPNSRFRMTDEVLWRYIQQQFESQPGPEVISPGRAGKPTLMGLDFFRRRWSSRRLAGARTRPSSTRSRPTAPCLTTGRCAYGESVETGTLCRRGDADPPWASLAGWVAVALNGVGLIMLISAGTPAIDVAARGIVPVIVFRYLLSPTGRRTLKRQVMG